MAADSDAAGGDIRIVYLGDRCVEAFETLDPSIIVLSELPGEPTTDDDIDIIDAIFVDIDDAADAARIASLIEGRPDSTVITLGESGDTAVTDACFEAGTNGHFEMPIDNQLIVGILAGVTDKAVGLAASSAPAVAGSETAIGDRQVRSDEPVRVLIVDDDDFIVESLVDIVEALEAEPVGCQTRAQAIAALESSTFDLVLLDSRLPDLSEQQVLDAIPALGDATVVAVMSGLPRTPPPGTTFMLKPFTLVDIRTLVDSAAERKERARCRS